MNFSWNLRAPAAHLWRSGLITAGQLAVLMIAVTLLTDGFYAFFAGVAWVHQNT